MITVLVTVHTNTDDLHATQAHPRTNRKVSALWQVVDG